MTYNAKLKSAIKNRGLSQKWIAAQIGIDYSLITRYINGDREPPPEHKRLLANILGVTQRSIFDE